MCTPSVLHLPCQAKLADQQQVDEEIRRANFLCVVYDSTVPLTQTLSSILAWMGRIEKLSRKVGVVGGLYLQEGSHGTNWYKN